MDTNLLISDDYHSHVIFATSVRSVDEEMSFVGVIALRAPIVERVAFPGVRTHGELQQSIFGEPIVFVGSVAFKCVIDDWFELIGHQLPENKANLTREKNRKTVFLLYA